MLEYAIVTNNLTASYTNKNVIENINLRIKKGEISGIIGPNGAGKSTLLKAIIGLIPYVKGDVIFNNETDLKSKLFEKISYVPQSTTIDWDFPATVYDVVMMGRYGLLGWFKRPGKKDKDIVNKIIDYVGMSEFSGRQISKLSGGQQQRIFLARALVQESEIYLLDEPFKGVDVTTEKMIISMLKALRNEGKTVVVVHHDLATVKEYFDEINFINLNLIASGKVSEVFNEENLSKTYKDSFYFGGGQELCPKI